MTKTVEFTHEEAEFLRRLIGWHVGGVGHKSVTMINNIRIKLEEATSSKEGGPVECDTRSGIPHPMFGGRGIPYLCVTAWDDTEEQSHD